MKIYADTYNPETKKHIEIGGTKETIKADLKEMERIGLINKNCSVNIYAVDDQGKTVNLMEF